MNHRALIGSTKNSMMVASRRITAKPVIAIASSICWPCMMRKAFGPAPPTSNCTRHAATAATPADIQSRFQNRCLPRAQRTSFANM